MSDSANSRCREGEAVAQGEMLRRMVARQSGFHSPQERGGLRTKAFREPYVAYGLITVETCWRVSLLKNSVHEPLSLDSGTKLTTKLRLIMFHLARCSVSESISKKSCSRISGCRDRKSMGVTSIHEAHEPKLLCFKAPTSSSLRHFRSV